MISIILYVFTAIMWGIFATKMHTILNRQDKKVKCFILNTLFCPLAICLAIKNKEDNDKELIRQYKLYKNY